MLITFEVHIARSRSGFIACKWYDHSDKNNVHVCCVLALLIMPRWAEPRRQYGSTSRRVCVCVCLSVFPRCSHATAEK